MDPDGEPGRGSFAGIFERKEKVYLGLEPNINPSTC
jgi:hypothetical protein